jgi:S1-C subfamily serine protease
MAKKKPFEAWTLDELIAEVRHRERAGTDRTRAAGTKQAKPRISRHHGLHTVPSRQLVKAVQDRQRVIYGVDDRQDLYQVKSAKVKQVSDAVVALVKKSDLTRKANGSYTLATTSYQQEYDLCGSEPFASQPLGCFCTGFLVKPDTIATAGHCVKSQADLAGIRFVFGFRMTNSATARNTFPAEDVYTGVKLIGRQQVDDGPDWALVRLDRPVQNHKPVSIRTSGKISSAQKLFVIGHPCGLPMKYAPGAAVRRNDADGFFVANLDTYGGNSGSPVFNGKTYRIEGILVRGENDFVSNGTCQVSLVCPSTGCRGEDVTRSTVWAPKIP